MFNRKEISKCEGKSAVWSGDLFVYERSFMQTVALTTGRAIVVLLEVFAVHLERHCLPSLRLAEMIQSIID